ncbi:MAG: hypothetical protein J7639_17915, partial [Paenibacillaceae bacterium]|nr:hypothetical protein [Paenibacillaceae bacterium]
FPSSPVAYIAIKDVTTNHMYAPMPLTAGGPAYVVSTKPGVNNLDASHDFQLIVFNASYPNTFSGGITVYQHP